MTRENQMREKNTSRPPTKLLDINKKSDVSRCAVQCAQTAQANGQQSHRGGLAPFPPRCGAAVPRVKPQVKEEKKDFFADSVLYVQRLVEKYGNKAEQEKKKHSWTFRKTVAQR
ncbi:hypothetical protein DPX16_21529 [Anabarilius grahami]|uniref:Uncharacterized protein n=1 Tax=Anabarilius grahami TaxID=495550 RepID=A0A3N0XVZ6_ANAGA|nr:hypothetical protein DPX16_21529 [Anabarilius grahami]